MARRIRRKRRSVSSLPPGIDLDGPPPWRAEQAEAWLDYLERARPDLDPLAQLIAPPGVTVREILATPKEDHR